MLRRMAIPASLGQQFPGQTPAPVVQPPTPPPGVSVGPIAPGNVIQPGTLLAGASLLASTVAYLILRSDINSVGRQITEVRGHVLDIEDAVGQDTDTADDEGAEA